MKRSVFIIVCVLTSLVLLVRMRNSASNLALQNLQQPDTSWIVQLNEMNYLVLKASSINLIFGLHLSKEQAQQLKPLAEQLALALPAVPDTKGKCSGDLALVRSAYLQLVNLLVNHDSIPLTLQKEVFRVRDLESGVITKTLLGAQTTGYRDEGCLKCHATPATFSKEENKIIEPDLITPERRKEIDLAHVKGLFGEEATLLLWQLKEKVWNILSNGQRFVIKDFRCCLVPSDVITDPAHIGQAAFSGGWADYLANIRKLKDEDWDAYKYLFLAPVRELIKATLPGIRENEIRSRMKQVESIISQARKLSRLDFDIQTENYCTRLSKATSIDQLNGESSRSQEDRQFTTAMFLLYFGSPEQYGNIIGQKK